MQNFHKNNIRWWVWIHLHARTYFYFGANIPRWSLWHFLEGYKYNLVDPEYLTQNNFCPQKSDAIISVLFTILILSKSELWGLGHMLGLLKKKGKGEK